jgi:opacity protein-like surface antigen
MKKLLLAAALTFAAAAAQAQGVSQNSHPVQSTGGTYTAPHQQTNPNTQRGSGTGNANPSTGGVGTRNPKN